MLKRTLASVTVGVLLAGAAVAAGPADLVGQKALRGLECAMLAGAAGNTIFENGEPERLYRYGSEAVKASMQALRALPGYADAFGPHFAIMAAESDDFFVGMAVANAAADIDRFLSTEVPLKLGDSTDQIKALRELIARKEFNRRNCSIVGR